MKIEAERFSGREGGKLVVEESKSCVCVHCYTNHCKKV